jgi:Tc5 transposase DNA-binding domain
MVNEADMERALAECQLSDKPNYAYLAVKYTLDRTTIMRRHKGQSRSRAQFLSESSQCLTIEQEAVLIKHINRMTDRNIPPTAQIVRNLAEEMIGREVGKNWTGEFVHRYRQTLKSVYLSNIDHKRVKAKYAPMWQHFYDLVFVFALLLCFNLLFKI